jgi:hypothetical protein
MIRYILETTFELAIAALVVAFVWVAAVAMGA